jgi:hypothetical protein
MKNYGFVLIGIALLVLMVPKAQAATLDEVIAKMNAYRTENAANPAVLGAYASGAFTTEEDKAALPPEQSQVIVNDLRTVTGANVGTIVTKRLMYGMENDEDVKALQAFLCAKGYLNPCTVTGNFYTKTKAALQKFQASRGITGQGADGTIVGTKTMWALSEAY